MDFAFDSPRLVESRRLRASAPRRSLVVPSERPISLAGETVSTESSGVQVDRPHPCAPLSLAPVSSMNERARARRRSWGLGWWGSGPLTVVVAGVGPGRVHARSPLGSPIRRARLATPSAAFSPDASSFPRPQPAASTSAAVTAKRSDVDGARIAPLAGRAGPAATNRSRPAAMTVRARSAREGAARPG